MIKQYIVDAFTSELFHGNQAAICLLDKWLPEKTMMAIARENRFSETAFLVGTHLRWFTPGGEIDLCGHATLASAYVMFHYVCPKERQIRFQTLSGELLVTREKDRYTMSFPAYHLQRIDVTKEMEDALGVMPSEAYLGRDLLLIYDSEDIIYDLAPDQALLKKLPGLLVHVSAKGQNYDCVSRSFGPKLGIVEDSVCGSGHCHIVPYWTKRLHKQDLIAYQASERGGILYCRDEGERVQLSGEAVLFLEGQLYIHEEKD